MSEYVIKVEKERKPKKKKKLKFKGNAFKGKILRKPKAKITSINPERFITKGLGDTPLVKKGKVGYIEEEMIEEKVKWMS